MTYLQHIPTHAYTYTRYEPLIIPLFNISLLLTLPHSSPPLASPPQNTATLHRFLVGCFITILSLRLLPFVPFISFSRAYTVSNPHVPVLVFPRNIT